MVNVWLSVSSHTFWTALSETGFGTASSTCALNTEYLEQNSIIAFALYVGIVVCSSVCSCCGPVDPRATATSRQLAIYPHGGHKPLNPAHFSTPRLPQNCLLFHLSWLALFLGCVAPRGRWTVANRSDLRSTLSVGGVSRELPSSPSPVAEYFRTSSPHSCDRNVCWSSVLVQDMRSMLNTVVLAWYSTSTASQCTNTYSNTTLLCSWLYCPSEGNGSALQCDSSPVDPSRVNPAELFFNGVQLSCASWQFTLRVCLQSLGWSKPQEQAKVATSGDPSAHLHLLSFRCPPPPLLLQLPLPHTMQCPLDMVYC